ERAGSGWPPLQRQFAAEALLPARSGRAPGRALAVPVSEAAHDPTACLMAIRVPKPPGRRRKPAWPPQEENGKNGANGRAPVAEQAAEVGTGIVGWVDERTGASGFLRGFLFRKVPKGTNWFYTLGSATMFAFLSQAVTGVFLAMYYEPSPTRAYDSVQHITNDVFLGELVRGMHRWGATVMVILLFLHMGRTFFF